MQKIVFLFLFLISNFKSNAQDAILFSEGNFIRGEITSTDYSSVAILLEDKSTAYYHAQNVKQFVWNGETYVSKPIVVKKQMEYHFFKLLTFGKVNLYAFGEKSSFMLPQKKIQKSSKPSYSVGMGTGGMGASISLGNSNVEAEPLQLITPSEKSYYLEKPGTGPIQQISLKAEKTKQTKSILAQKMGHKPEIAEQIKKLERIDLPSLINLVNNYNESK